jgi:hypothetical protein
MGNGSGGLWFALGILGLGAAFWYANSCKGVLSDRVHLPPFPLCGTPSVTASGTTSTSGQQGSSGSTVTSTPPPQPTTGTAVVPVSQISPTAQVQISSVSIAPVQVGQYATAYITIANNGSTPVLVTITGVTTFGGIQQGRWQSATMYVPPGTISGRLMSLGPIAPEFASRTLTATFTLSVNGQVVSTQSATFTPGRAAAQAMV